jgi:hypothetical protein
MNYSRRLKKYIYSILLKEVYGYAARYVTRKQTRQETPRYMA